MRPGKQVPLTWTNLTQADGQSQAALEIVTTAVMSEARQSFNNWGTLITRLWQKSGEIELEWTVGPIPIDDKVGKEVMIRVVTDINSGTLYK